MANDSDLVTLTIDGMSVQAPKNASILQACESVGIEIPRFCYHDRLSVPANCRMCLVEVEKERKPVPSCALPVREGMVVHTRSQQTLKARHGVMEMLLINHPLDCPICDQGGECDLQDQAIAYGFDRGRYQEAKRAVDDKDLGPLIKTFMTRCIHCTRCVRFMDEIAGTQELGMTSRGEESEIGTFTGEILMSEMQGNLADVCPVGALVSGPYAFAARPWELRRVESVDVLDAVGSNIRLDVRGGEVMRVLPALHEEINEEWLGDRSRYAYDGLKRRRLDRPYVRRDGRLVPVSWEEALKAAATGLMAASGTEVAGLIGDQADAESIFALKQLLGSLGSPHLDCRQDGALAADPALPSGWLLNAGLAGIEEADAILIVGSYPRWEAAILNARIRKRWLQNRLPIGLIGENRTLTYPVTYLGAGGETLRDLAEGRHSFAQVLSQAKKPLILLGSGLLARPDGAAILHLAAGLAEQCGAVQAEGWTGFGVIQTAAARVAGLMLGAVPGPQGLATQAILQAARSGAIKTLYLLGVDELDLSGLERCFVIYQGHHGDAGARVADVILPGAAYTEKTALYASMEGRVQSTRQAVFPPGEAREDWRILRALSGVLGRPLPFESLPALRASLARAHPAFGRIGSRWAPGWSRPGQPGPLHEAPFVTPMGNYYQTCAISRASLVLQECTDRIMPLIQPALVRTGTDV